MTPDRVQQRVSSSGGHVTWGHAPRAATCSHVHQPVLGRGNHLNAGYVITTAVCTHRPALNANTAIYLLSGPRTPAHRQRTTQPLRNNTLEHSDGKIAHISTHVLCTEGGEEEMQEVKDVPKQYRYSLTIWFFMSLNVRWVDHSFFSQQVSQNLLQLQTDKSVQITMKSMFCKYLSLSG